MAAEEKAGLWAVTVCMLLAGASAARGVDLLPFPQDTQGRDYRVNEVYGPRIIDLGEMPEFHLGLDLNNQGATDADQNEPLVAPAAGMLFALGRTSTDLKWAGVDYGQGRTFAYLHTFTGPGAEHVGDYKTPTIWEGPESYRRFEAIAQDGDSGVILSYSGTVETVADTTRNSGYVMRALTHSGVITDPVAVQTVMRTVNGSPVEYEIIAVPNAQDVEDATGRDAEGNYPSAASICVRMGANNALETSPLGDDEYVDVQEEVDGVLVTRKAIRVGANRRMDSIVGRVVVTDRVSAGDVIAPVGNSPSGAFHLHLQVADPGNHKLINPTTGGESGDDGLDNVIQYLERDDSYHETAILQPEDDGAVVYYRAPTPAADDIRPSWVNARVKFRIDGMSIEDRNNFKGYELDRVRLFTFPASIASSEYESHFEGYAYLIGRQRNGRMLDEGKWDDRRDPFRTEFDLGGTTSSEGDNDFPRKVNNGIDLTTELDAKNNVRIHVPAVFPDTAEWRFYFNQWNPRLRRDYTDYADYSGSDDEIFSDENLLARLNQEGEYPDGEYNLVAVAESVDRDPTERGVSDPRRVVVDNFRPYVTGVFVVGMDEPLAEQVLYDVRWEFDAESGVLTRTPYADQTIPAGRYQGRVAFSEPMEACTVELEGFGRVDDGDSDGPYGCQFADFFFTVSESSSSGPHGFTISATDFNQNLLVPFHLEGPAAADLSYGATESVYVDADGVLHRWSRYEGHYVGTRGGTSQAVAGTGGTDTSHVLTVRPRIGPPVGFAATAGDEEVELAWGPPLGGPIAGYRLYRRWDGQAPGACAGEFAAFPSGPDGVEFCLIADEDALPETAVEYTDAGLDSTTAYYYVLEAIDAAGIRGVPTEPVGAMPYDALRVPGEYGSIGAAISAAGDGDVIMVRPGTYTENSLEMPGSTRIRLWSEQGPGQTVIDGGGQGVLVHVSDGSEVVGFTIVDFDADYHGAINCYFADQSLIANNVLVSNYVGIGIGGYTGSPTMIFNNTFVANEYGAMGSWNLAANLRNNIFSGNTQAALTRLYKNNVIQHNLFTGSRSAEIEYWTPSYEAYNTESDNLFNQDPRFVRDAPEAVDHPDPAQRADYHLRSDSPAIDAGDPSLLLQKGDDPGELPWLEEDLVWQDADGTVADLGAYGGPFTARWVTEDHDGDGDPDSSDPDDDNDGLPDTVEDVNANNLFDSPPDQTDLRDADTDDDGLVDGNAGSEDLNADGVVDPGETGPSNWDTDGDGISDGTERGLTAPETPDTDLSVGHFVADEDPSTTTDPTDADTDEDGVLDGYEDANGNGRVDSGESDPLDPDTDGDGIYDGTEIGLAAPHLPDATDLTAGFFVADADPSTTTDPTNPDSDGDGIPDGEEDANRNGAWEMGETPSGSSICSGDLTLDLWVDFLDVEAFAPEFGRVNCAGGCLGDLDTDGDVDGTDQRALIKDIGRVDCR